MTEKLNWQNTDISLKKTEITPGDLELAVDTLPREFVRTNVENLLQHPLVKGKRGIFSEKDFTRSFNLVGGYRIGELTKLGDAQKFFNQREGRFYAKMSGSSAEYSLRGTRYFCATDSNLSVRQKLKILEEDAFDGIDFLKTKPLPREGQFMLVAPVLDYVKNTSTALLNAYIFNEKLDDWKPVDSSYIQTREKLIHLVRKASLVYNLALLDLLDETRLNEILQDEVKNLISEVSAGIKESFRKHEFPNDALARPEASHPLVLLGSSGVMLGKHPGVETVIGMPAGSAEASCLLAEMYEYFGGVSQCDVVFLPISSHTIKKVKKSGEPNHHLPSLIENEREKIDGKKILILDDNASTGSTMQKARDEILENAKPAEVICAVLEADIIRSTIDIKSPKRKNIANPLLYNSSVAVLPVSRHIQAKQDLREIMEINQLISSYKAKIREASSPVESIKYEVFIDDLENPTEVILEKLPTESIIDKFQGTFLSNFYAVPVERGGRVYPSVEHAYQAAKFSVESFTNLSQEQRNVLAEILKQKGYAQPVEDFWTIFFNPTITSNITKVVANQMRDWGLVRSDWDDVRISIMIELLIQKFNVPELRAQILDTGDKYLIEGNTWDDTLWGVCDGVGKNMLGRVLMNLREKIKASVPQ